MLAPIRLPANQPAARFYRGGERIAAFRGDPAAQPNTPEDWVGSTTSVRGHAPVGLTRLPDGSMLADAVAADPAGWLGDEHVASFGADTKLLVKLLDPGQRLPIHAHPHRDFAASHLGEIHGKAEAWYILAPGTVYLGLRDDLEPAHLAELVATQQTDRMLSLMHEVRVGAGDSVYVPPGLLHAIGEGVLLAEVQEPTDLSILLEWQGFDLDGSADGHLALGFDLALQAVETRERSADDVAGLIVRGAREGSALAPAADEYFRLDRVTRPTTLRAGFAVIIGIASGLSLATPAGVVELPAGSTILVPAAAGALRFGGSGEILVARPPVATNPPMATEQAHP